MSKTKEELAGRLYEIFKSQVFTHVQHEDLARDIYNDVLIDGNVDLEETAAGILDFLNA